MQGAGNIGKDDSTLYTDGGIVREGVAGESTNPEYSSGVCHQKSKHGPAYMLTILQRGGAGNIVDSPKVRAAASEDMIPEPSVRNSGEYANFHTGVSVLCCAYGLRCSDISCSEAEEVMSTRKSMVVTVMLPVKALVRKSSTCLAWIRIRSTRRSTRRNRCLNAPGKED